MRKTSNRFGVVFTAALATAASVAGAQTVPYTSTSGTLTQSFDTLASTGTGVAWVNNTTIPGWSLFRNPAPGTAIGTYNTDNGSSNAGSFNSYGVTGSSERALGGAGSGGTYFGSPSTGSIAGWIVFGATNNTGGDITGANLSFDGEQWRNGGNVNAQTMVFEWGVGTSFTTVPSWTAPGGTFDWTSPVATASAATVVGNATGLVAGRGGNLSMTVPAGQSVFFRWVERNDTGNDHGLAIDNVSVSFAFNAPTPSSAKDLRWSGGASGNWDTTSTNWVTITGTGSSLAFVNGDAATFASGPATTVTVAEAVGAGSLTFAGGSNVTLTGGSQVTVAGTGGLRLEGTTLNVGNTGGLVNLGALSLSGNNTVAVSTLLDVGSGAYQVPAGSSLAVQPGGLFSSATLDVNAGSLSVASGATLQTGLLTVSNTALVVDGSVSSTGGITLGTGASLTVSSTGVVGPAAPLVSNAGGPVAVFGTLALTGATMTGGGRLTVATDGRLTSTAAVNVDGDVSISGNASLQGLNMAIGSGTFTANTGAAIVFTGGTSNLNASAAGGNVNTDITLRFSGNRVNFNTGTFSGSGRLLLETSTNPASTNSYTVANAGTVTNGATATVALDVVLNANNNPGQIVLNLGSSGTGGSGAATLAYTGSISGAGTVNLGVGNGGAGLTLIANTQTYTGVTTVNSSGLGTHRLGVSDALPTSTSLVFNTQNTNAAVGTVDLNGFNQTVAALRTGVAFAPTGTNVQNGGRVTNTSASPATLTINVNEDATFAGGILGNLSVVKNGFSIQTLSGFVNTTGALTVNGGRVVLPGNTGTNYFVGTTVGSLTVTSGYLIVPNATGDLTGGNGEKAPGVVVVSGPISVASGGFIDLKNNDLIARSGDVANLRSLVGAWVQSSADNGLGTTAGGTIYGGVTTLAVFPNTDAAGNAYFGTYNGVSLAASDVIVKYTYVGDTNVDGKVDANDLTNLLEGLSTGATGWQNGDLNYDNVVDQFDFQAFNALYGQTLPPISNGNPSGGSYGAGAIPEPSSLGLLVAAGLPLVARRRRSR